MVVALVVVLMGWIQITVKLFSLMRLKFGFLSQTLDCEPTFEGFLIGCEQKFGREFVTTFYDLETHSLRDKFTLLINGTNLQFLPTPLSLKDHDVIAIFPPAAGG